MPVSSASATRTAAVKMALSRGRRAARRKGCSHASTCAIRSARTRLIDAYSISTTPIASSAAAPLVGLPGGLPDRARDRGGEAERPRDAIGRGAAGRPHEADERGHEQRRRQQPEEDPEGDPAGQQRAGPATVEIAGLQRRVHQRAPRAQLSDASLDLLARSHRAPARGPRLVGARCRSSRRAQSSGSSPPSSAATESPRSRGSVIAPGWGGTRSGMHPPGTVVAHPAFGTEPGSTCTQYPREWDISAHLVRVKAGSDDLPVTGRPGRPAGSRDGTVGAR